MNTSTLEQALEVLGNAAFVEALTERQELLRFGASRITYQHSEERLVVRVKLVRDGRAAWGSPASLEPGALRDMRSRLEDLLRELPPDGAAWLPEPECPVRSAETAFASTTAVGAAERVGIFRRVIDGLPEGTEVGGSVATTVVRHALAGSTGLRREEERTRALLQVVARRGEQSAYARWVHRDAGALDVDTVLGRAQQYLEPLPSCSLEPGSYRAVLQPTAVMVLLASLGQCAFNGRAFLDNESVFSGQLGQPVLSPALTVLDDGADRRGLPTGFDCEGVRKARVPLVIRGVLSGQVTDTLTARRSGGTSTGHAAPPGWRFGSDPCPSHLVVEPGAMPEIDLIAACGTGLLIQRVDYVRVVHARETLVTGTTRDATCWIEDGRVAARLPQFRFTLRLVDLFNAVEALGHELERGEMVFMESLTAPAVLVTAFPVGSVVESQSV